MTIKVIVSGNNDYKFYDENGTLLAIGHSRLTFAVDQFGKIATTEQKKTIRSAYARLRDNIDVQETEEEL